MAQVLKVESYTPLHATAPIESNSNSNSLNFLSPPSTPSTMATVQTPMASSLFSGYKQAGFSTSQLSLASIFINNGQISRLRTTGRSPGVRVRKYRVAIPCRRISCRSSSSNDDVSSTSNSDDGDDLDFVDSSVIEAVEVKNGSDGFMIKMRDGRYLKCVHNHPRGGYPPDYISHPAMVLKLEDGSDILLPIIVLEMPGALLMAALHNVEMARPTVYQVVMEMIETLGYKVKYVRVTKRVQEAYIAELCLTKMNDETASLSFDLRPSDAINIAVRCKAPIQVNKSLAQQDGLKIVEPANPVFRGLPDGSLLSEMDRPDGQPCPESEEFVLLRNMLIAAVEERYRDAAQWKQLLKQFRSKTR